MCRSHETWQRLGSEPDGFYHEKIARGLTVPTFDYMSASEAHAVTNGKYRGDGRRLDQYVTADPLLIDLPEA